MQNPLATPAIAVVWITIVVAWWTYSASFLMFDPFIMKTFPTLLPQEEIFIDTYASFIPSLWRGLTWLIAFTLAIFGCYLAPSYIERGGRTYDFSTGY